MKRNLFAVVLSLLIVLSMLLTGCNSKQAGPDAPRTKEPSQETREQGDKPDPITLSVFINMDWYWVDSFGGRPVDDEITKRTGVTLDVRKAAEQDQQLAILISSNDLPDLVYNGTRKLDTELVKHSYAYNELIEKYAPDFVVEPIVIANNTMEDGNFYTIKNNYSTPEEWTEDNPRFVASPGSPTLHVRQDILEALGNPEINTLADFENVLSKVKQKYPDMNALALGPDDQYGERYFKMTFGIRSGDSKVYEDGGKIYFQARDPKYLEAYKYMNKLYRSGYIDAESLIYKYEDFQQAVTSGKSFSAARSVDLSSIANKAFENAGLPYKMKILSKMLSDEAGTVNDSIGWAGLYITKNCKAPDRAIKFAQFLRSDEGQKLCVWGIQGEHYNLTSDGYPDLTPQMKELASDYENMVRTVGNMAWSFAVTSKPEGVWNFNEDERTEWLRMSKERIKEFKPVYNFVVPTENIEETVIYSKVVDYEKTQTVKLISAETEEQFMSTYNEMLQKLDAMGLKQLEGWMTNKYNSIKDRYK
jgi:putative aldouronate transport system substrate-binding protein